MNIRAVSRDAAPWPLLLLADPSRERVQAYLDTAEIFVGEEGGVTVAVAVVQKCNREIELLNIASAENFRGRGYGKRILQHVLGYALDAGVARVTVGTGNSSLRALAFYQRNGFRITGVQRGFFDTYEPPIVEDGIRCRDAIRLSFEIENRHG
jgi:ribosomal protein S18 acetylase RimI-like enzyme